jgi:DNA-binding NarL/FixJ family response regulator
MATIRKEFPEAKIIILTTESDVEDAMKLGARAYLAKMRLHKELPGTNTRRLLRELEASR